jgi:hypothetical protein
MDNGDFRSWLIPLLWGLVIVYLVSGYVPHLGRFGGPLIISRKKDSFGYWLDCLFYLAVTVALTFWWDSIFK